MRKKEEKENSWKLYRECDRILRENYQKWQERKISENLRKLEEEKADRLATATKKKSEVLKKLRKPKKETKSETTRRLEKEKKLKGMQQMKSNLWKQRRDQDQAIRDTWMQVKEAAKHENIRTGTSLE